MKLEPLPPTFGTTRDALHTLAEHVVAPKRYAIDRHIWLLAMMGGFGTPVLANGVCVRVEGTTIVTQDADLHRRASITTLAAGAAFVEGPLGAPAQVYPPATPCDPDAPIDLDPGATAVFAAWIAFANGVLGDISEEFAAHDPSEAKIWPEHFDMACELGDVDAGTRANYGASPGDAGMAEPYLYVGPWDATRCTGELAAYPFGAALRYGELVDAADPRAAALAFMRRNATTLLG